jgi:hypothetical protein
MPARPGMQRMRLAPLQSLLGAVRCVETGTNSGAKLPERFVPAPPALALHEDGANFERAAETRTSDIDVRLMRHSIGPPCPARAINCAQGLGSS